MSDEYIEVELSKDEKEAILKYADFFIIDDITKKDLLNKRKKWIKFTNYEITEVVGELSYYFNRTKNNHEFHFLDELISHLEYHIK